jgi:antirestriction protein ArdC
MCNAQHPEALQENQIMTTSTTPAHIDIHSRVTNKILADLENGVRTWQKPWNASHAGARITLPLRHNGTPYRGVNVLLLWCEAMEKGFNSPIWMTYKQASEIGAQVRKGELGSLVVYADRFTKKETDDQGAEIEREIPFMKGYTVFNVEQIEGLPAQYVAKPQESAVPLARIENAERFFAATGATIRHGGNRAFYSPARDFVQMPPRESFKDAASYSATLAHELTHWTAHPCRLARELGKRFGNEAYAAEELIAEMGSAFLCADLGITPEVREDHAAYLASWLKVMKADSRAIFTAAAQAQRAADYLHALQTHAESAAA